MYTNVRQLVCGSGGGLVSSGSCVNTSALVQVKLTVMKAYRPKIKNMPMSGIRLKSLNFFQRENSADAYPLPPP